jgi:hypothetical protein
MASGRKKNTDSVIADNFESRDLKKPEVIVQENMKTRTFQMKDSEYETLRTYFDKELGMKIGQGIRFVLHQYIKENVK